MKITIYELLGMVKDDKAPKTFKYDSYVWTYNYESSAYWNDKGVEFENYMDDGLMKYLNDEVEIIEEEKKTKSLTKDIEALGYACGEIQKCFTNGWTKSLENKSLEEEHKIPEKLDYKYENIYHNISKCKHSEIRIIDKINEILDYLEEIE